MAEFSYPFNRTDLNDAIPINAEVHADLFQSLYRNALAANIKARGHIAGTGANSTTTPLIVTQSTIPDLTVTVNVGRAILDGWAYVNTESKILTINANASGSTRYDSVVLQFTAADPDIRLAVKQGTASPPTLTDTLSFGITTPVSGVLEWEIARITVPNAASSIVNANIDYSYNIPIQSANQMVKIVASGTATSAFAALWTDANQRRISPLLIVVYNDYSVVFFSLNQGTTWHSLPSSFPTNQQQNTSGTITTSETTIATVNVTVFANRPVLILAGASMLTAPGPSLTSRIRVGGTQVFIQGLSSAAYTSLSWLYIPSSNGTITFLVSGQSSGSLSFQGGYIQVMQL